MTALLLAACGDNETNGPAEESPGTTATVSVAPGRHNQADVAFAQGMIVHHRQAVAMSEMAESHASSSDVKALAEKIQQAQEPEIATMSAWLKAWGEKVPEGMGGMGESPGMHHGHDGTPMPGMMDPQQMDQMMNQMKDARGKAFDTMFLNMMIKHHEGAIAMARTEKQEGIYGPAKKLADDIITAQTAEIARMRTMLNAA